MAAFSRLDLGPNLRTGLGPEYFRNLLDAAFEIIHFELPCFDLEAASLI